MAIATVKKPAAVTFLAVAVPAATKPFDNIADMRSAMKRVGTFGIVGSKTRPLLATVVTDLEVARVEKAYALHIEEGKDPVEFTDSAKIWSHGVDAMWLSAIVTDVERIVATFIDLTNGNDGSKVIASWNVNVNGYTVSARKVLGAFCGDKSSKLTLKGIVSACK